MDGMSAEEIVDNVWKTTRVKVGMTKEEYAERFVLTGDQSKAKSVVDSYYWQFVLIPYADSCFIVLDVSHVFLSFFRRDVDEILVQIINACRTVSNEIESLGDEPTNVSVRPLLTLQEELSSVYLPQAFRRIVYETLVNRVHDNER